MCISAPGPEKKRGGDDESDKGFFPIANSLVFNARVASPRLPGTSSLKRSAHPPLRREAARFPRADVRGGSQNGWVRGRHEDGASAAAAAHGNTRDSMIRLGSPTPSSSRAPFKFLLPLIPSLSRSLTLSASLARPPSPPPSLSPSLPLSFFLPPSFPFSLASQCSEIQANTHARARPALRGRLTSESKMPRAGPGRAVSAASESGHGDARAGGRPAGAGSGATVRVRVRRG